MTSPLINGLLSEGGFTPLSFAHRDPCFWWDVTKHQLLTDASGNVVLDGVNINKWRDAISNVSATQETDTNRPALDADGSNAGGRAVVFGGNDAMDIANGDFASFTELDVFIVGGCETLEAGVAKRIMFQWTSSPNFSFLLQKTTGDGYSLNYSTTGSDVLALNSTESAVSNVDHIFNFYTNGSNTYFAVDNESVVSGAGGIYGNSANGVQIGHKFTAQDIHINEIIVYKKMLNATERAIQKNSLQRKWGFV